MFNVPLIIVGQEENSASWRFTFDGQVSPAYQHDWQAMVTAINVCKHLESVLVVNRREGAAMAWEFVMVGENQDVCVPRELNLGKWA
jgi:hypothetical protein